MRSVKVFIVSIISILVVISLLGLLLPSKVTLTKSVLVEASPKEIRGMINDFSKWKNWYPTMQKENLNVVINNSSTITLIDNAGKSVTLQIILDEINEVDVQLTTPSSKEKVVYQFLLLPQKDEKTQLTLNVNTFLKWYPWEKLKGVLMDKMSGPQYLSILNQLKIAAEK